MARYIDADKLIRDLIDNRSFYPAIVKSAIENAPTEDVVPRSEVEKLENQLDSLSNQYRAGAEFLCNKAKQEVAKQIFEEIKAKIKLNLDYSHHTTILANVRAKVDAFSEIDDFIAELKKKYIGEIENENN